VQANNGEQQKDNVDIYKLKYFYDRAATRASSCLQKPVRDATFVKLVAALQLARLDGCVGIFQANRAVANAIGLG